MASGIFGVERDGPLQVCDRVISQFFPLIRQPLVKVRNCRSQLYCALAAGDPGI